MKQKLEGAANDLSSILPENVAILNNMQNNNIEIYNLMIENLKKQIDQLTKDSEEAEKQLQQKYEKIEQSMAPKEKELIDQHVKALQDQAKSVDLEAKRKNLMRRLGGEYDYNSLFERIDELRSDFSQVKRDYDFEVKKYFVDVPKLDISEKDLKDLNYQMPSILDEMKQRLGIDFTKYQ